MFLPSYGFSQMPITVDGSTSEKFVVEGKFINSYNVKCHIYLDVNNEWIYQRSELFNRNYRVSLSSFNIHLIVFESDTYHKPLCIAAERPVTVIFNPDFRTSNHSMIIYNEKRGIYMFKVFTKQKTSFIPIKTKE